MAQWITEAAGKMYVNKITQIDLAKHMGVTNDYISLIMRGKKRPRNIEKRIMQAIDDLIANKS